MQDICYLLLSDPENCTGDRDADLHFARLVLRILCVQSSRFMSSEFDWEVVMESMAEGHGANCPVEGIADRLRNAANTLSERVQTTDRQAHVVLVIQGYHDMGTYLQDLEGCAHVGANEVVLYRKRGHAGFTPHSLCICRGSGVFVCVLTGIPSHNNTVRSKLYVKQSDCREEWIC